MEKPQRRPVSLAGLGLISAGAVLGLTLATPASAAPQTQPRPDTTTAPAIDDERA
jgi:hypothetical protein